MSGLVRGKIESVINTGNLQADAQVFFKNLYDFFTGHPNVTIIALQYGLSTTNVPGSTSSGTGTGYYDGANSFGFNAFFVARLNATTARPFDVYVLVQWAGAPNITGGSPGFGSAPGSPGQELGSGQGNTWPNNSCGSIALQVVIGIGGSGGSAGSPNNGNPWKGTTNVNGADTKAASGAVWGAPSGGGTGVVIFPRSNDSSNGAFRTLAQNCIPVSYFSSNAQQQRMGIVADDDSFVIMVDLTDNGNYSLTYGGLYAVRSNVPAGMIPYPYVALCQSLNNLPLTFSDQSVYGDVAGTGAAQGGIVSTLTGSVASLQLDHYVNNFLGDTNFWPDRQMANLGTVYNEFPIWVGIFEQVPLQQSGWLGQLTFLKEMYNVPTNDTKADFSRIFLGSTTLAQSKVSAPWDSQNNTAPRSGTTRAGVTFVTTLGVSG